MSHDVVVDLPFPPQISLDLDGARDRDPAWVHRRQLLAASKPSADTCTARWRSLPHSSQNPDGGWGHRSGDPSDPISTAHALTASLPVRECALAPEGSPLLMDQQDPDGGLTSIPDQAAPRPIPYDFPVLADIFALGALGQHSGQHSGQG